jgi:hypothetical protein
LPYLLRSTSKYLVGWLARSKRSGSDRSIDRSTVISFSSSCIRVFEKPCFGSTIINSRQDRDGSVRAYVRTNDKCKGQTSKKIHGHNNIYYQRRKQRPTTVVDKSLDHSTTCDRSFSFSFVHHDVVLCCVGMESCFTMPVAVLHHNQNSATGTKNVIINIIISFRKYAVVGTCQLASRVIMTFYDSTTTTTSVSE